MREVQTEVLVVGAGPVGLWTALVLAEAGIQVSVIDREARTAARSYACALHPRTLTELNRFGLAQPALQEGRRIRTLAFYEGESRHAEIDLSVSGGEFPFLLILPQDRLEGLLEKRLMQAGVAVNWNYRFDAVQMEERKVTVTIEQLTGTATGYIVPHWDTVVHKRLDLPAQFLIGADGAHSLVRDRLGIGCEPAGEPVFFAAYEFEADQPPPDEVRVVLDESSTNVLWPLSGNRCRWTFQMVQADASADFPEKERRAVRFVSSTVDEEIRRYVQKVARQRAPWFAAGVKEVTWCTRVGFEPRLARQLGRHRCWLAGDAAHQAGPVGVQSMNAGFHEGTQLAECVRRVLREHAALEPMERLDRDHRDTWRAMLGLMGNPRTLAGTAGWASKRAARILPCLPGVGPDLSPLARQLGLELAGFGSP